MKKTTTSLLTSALILFCAGLLLALCATLYAKIAKVEVYDVEKKDRTIENITVSLDQILANSPDSNFVKKLSETEYQSVEIHSFAGDVVICPGAEKTELVLDKANTNNLSYKISGDTLIIEEVDPVGFLGFYIDKGGLSFAGLRHIFHPGNAINSRKTITLKLSKNVNLDHLEVNSTIGDVSIDEVSAGNITVKSSNGKISLNKLKNPNGKIVVQGNSTDVSLDQCQYVSCSVSTHFGDVVAHLIESASQSTILDLWVGDIDVKTDLPTTFYKLSLSTSAGKIKKNGEGFEKKLTQDGTAAVRISSGILMGDFNLEFAGDDESKFQSSLPKEETETTEEQSTGEAQQS